MSSKSKIKLKWKAAYVFKVLVLKIKLNQLWFCLFRLNAYYLLSKPTVWKIDGLEHIQQQVVTGLKAAFDTVHVT